jgi:hypothetical protein
MSDKKILPVFLLFFFLAWLGVHRFYVGKIGTAILFIITLGGVGIWWIIDLILIVTGNFKDSRETRSCNGPSALSSRGVFTVIASTQRTGSVRSAALCEPRHYRSFTRLNDSSTSRCARLLRLTEPRSGEEAGQRLNALRSRSTLLGTASSAGALPSNSMAT